MDFLQILFQRVKFVLRKFQVFQPFLVLGLAQRRRLVVNDHVLTDPGEISRDEGSNDVEAAGCPCSARPIGVEAGVEPSGAVDGDVPASDFIFASSASNSRMR